MTNTLILTTITEENIYSACRSSDAMGCPDWLDELIDLGINHLQTELEPEAWQKLCENISEGKY